MSYADPPEEPFAAILTRSVLAALLLACLFGLLAMTCGCSARSQQTLAIRPPEVIEVKVPVPAPCPVPPEIPPLDLWSPMVDPLKSDVQTLLRVKSRDLAACVMSYEQAVELLRIYIQQAEVVNATPTPEP